MKKIRIMMLMICSICAFTACSDDDDPTPQKNIIRILFDNLSFGELCILIL